MGGSFSMAARSAANSGFYSLCLRHRGKLFDGSAQGLYLMVCVNPVCLASECPASFWRMSGATPAFAKDETNVCLRA